MEIDDNWFKEVTESSEEAVREFLEVSNKQNKEYINRIEHMKKM